HEFLLPRPGRWLLRRRELVLWTGRAELQAAGLGDLLLRRGPRRAARPVRRQRPPDAPGRPDALEPRLPADLPALPRRRERPLPGSERVERRGVPGEALLPRRGLRRPRRGRRRGYRGDRHRRPAARPRKPWPRIGRVSRGRMGGPPG